MNSFVKLAEVQRVLGTPDLAHASFNAAMNKVAVGGALAKLLPYLAGGAAGAAGAGGLYGLSRLAGDDESEFDKDPMMEAALMSGLRRKAMMDRAQMLHGLLSGRELPQPAREQQLSRFR